MTTICIPAGSDRLAGLPFKKRLWMEGKAPNLIQEKEGGRYTLTQNHRFSRRRLRSFKFDFGRLSDGFTDKPVIKTLGTAIKRLSDQLLSLHYIDGNR